jgi:exonuclease SbcC
LRNPVTLSGGEKFQVSLAIALGLAQVVSERSGSIRIDTLFVDEGFGSLSKNVLETAMCTLDALKQGGRTIGVISHVDKMQETIEAKLHVAKVPGGPSFVKAIDA